jgi:deazaflavin-dependent oxidoreductase (nitroreductase family)
MTAAKAPHLGRLWRLLFRAPTWPYRWRCGWLFGRRFLVLGQVGRHSGLRRYTMLEVIEYRPAVPEAIVISAFGRNADWLRNIEATSSAEVIIGATRFAAAWRRLDAAEAARAVLGYQRRHRLIAPVIRLVLSRFLGWRYDGSERHARRLAAQLPVIAFRPAGAVSPTSPRGRSAARDAEGSEAANGLPAPHRLRYRCPSVTGRALSR